MKIYKFLFFLGIFNLTFGLGNLIVHKSFDMYLCSIGQIILGAIALTISIDNEEKKRRTR